MMMKKLSFAPLLAVLLMLMTRFALAGDDPFTLDEAVVLNGMPCSWAQGYEPVISGDVMTLHFPLRAPANVGNVTVTLRLADERVSPFKGETSATFQRMEGLYRVALRLPLRSDRVSGDYAATVHVEGAASDGGSCSADFPLVIAIRDGKTPPDARPVWSDVAAELRVGEDAVFTATLTNPGRYAAMTGLTLTLSDPSGDILPAFSDKIALPDLMPGASAEVSVPVRVVPTAAVALHRLVCSLTWSALGQPGSWEETFTLPVTQEMRVSHGAPDMASSILQGGMGALTLPVMNLGRADLRNVIATLTLPGICDGNSVLIGTVAPGETKDAKLTFTSGKDVLGDVTGEVRVTCEDPWGNESGFSVPVTLTIEAPAPPPAASSADEAAVETPGWLIPALGGLSGAALLALALQGALLRRKIRHLEEDRL